MSTLVWGGERVKKHSEDFIENVSQTWKRCYNPSVSDSSVVGVEMAKAKKKGKPKTPKRVMVNTGVSLEDHKRLTDYRERQEAQPSEPEVMRTALRQFLDRAEADYSARSFFLTENAK